MFCEVGLPGWVVATPPRERWRVGCIQLNSRLTYVLKNSDLQITRSFSDTLFLVVLLVYKKRNTCQWMGEYKNSEHNEGWRMVPHRAQSRRRRHNQGQMHTAAACDKFLTSETTHRVWNVMETPTPHRWCQVMLERQTSKRQFEAENLLSCVFRWTCTFQKRSDLPKPSSHVTSRPESVLSLQIQGRMPSTFRVRDQQIRFQKRFCLFFGVCLRKYPVLLSGRVLHRGCNIILGLLYIKWCSRGHFCTF